MTETAATPLHNQVAIITGASSGLGRATAMCLTQHGAKAIVNYPPSSTEEQMAAATVAEIAAAGGEAIAVAADVSKEDQVEAMVSETVRQFGTFHILVANAGIERPAPIQDMSLSDWQAVLDVNLTGAFLTARAGIREFLRRGPAPDLSTATGKIVFTSSVHQRIPWASQGNYAASKAGLAMLMQTLAQEVGPYKIRVNSVAPGAIRTPINTEAWDTEQARHELLQLIPYGRIGAPADVARAVAWLVSDAADYITGATLRVDGGMALYPAFRGHG